MLWLPSVDGDWATAGALSPPLPAIGEARMTGGWRKCSCCIRSQVAQRAASHPPLGRSAARV